MFLITGGLLMVCPLNNFIVKAQNNPISTSNSNITDYEIVPSPYDITTDNFNKTKSIDDINQTKLLNHTIHIDKQIDLKSQVSLTINGKIDFNMNFINTKSNEPIPKSDIQFTLNNGNNKIDPQSFNQDPITGSYNISYQINMPEPPPTGKAYKIPFNAEVGINSIGSHKFKGSVTLELDMIYYTITIAI